jgi:predicted nucleotidyltransferase
MMLERLFSSRVRVELMTLFLLHPDVGYYARELSRLVDANYSAIWKELINLEQVGLLLSESMVGRKVYRLNTGFPILPELRSIILKTVGVGEQIREALEAVKGIEAVFIYGSFSRGQPDMQSDLDLMVIGEIRLAEFSSTIASIEDRIARAVNYIIYSQEEWKTKLEEGDPFILNVIKGDKIMLIGSIDEL